MMAWWEWQVPLPWALFACYIVGVLLYAIGFAHGGSVPEGEPEW